MFCKMDFDDPFVRDPREYRRFACDCLSEPAPATEGCGCVCSACSAACSACLGFGWAEPPVRRVSAILSSVRSQLKRRLRLGRGPGFVRLPPREISVLIKKREGEEESHPITEYVDPGPPLRVCDVLVVRDRRRE